MNVLLFLRKIYSIPVVKQTVHRMAVGYLREAAKRTDNTVDDKLVSAVEVALNNENYKAVLNGRKAAKVLSKIEGK